ncbi:MAG: type VII secretion protein EccE [Rhodococcus sp. (in: high G+C Gram-positive bacteria)]
MHAPTRRRSITNVDEPPAPRPANPAPRRHPVRTKPVLALRFPPLTTTLVVELLVTASAAAALLLSSRTVLVLALLLALLPFVVVAGRPIPDWVVTVVRFATRSTTSPGVTTEMQLQDGEVAGIHRRQDRLSCVLELRPPRGAVTRLAAAESNTDSPIDLNVLGSCLTQHDISLSGIDVVSHGVRATSGSPASEVYEQLIGPLPAVATRTVWVSVTLDVRTNRDAVAARGGGELGGSRTVRIATERVARALEARGIHSRILTRHEIQAAAVHMCRGVPFESFTESWCSTPLPGVTRVGHGLDVGTLDNRGLDRLWATSTLSSSVILHLEPGPDQRVVMSGSCGFVGRSTPRVPKLPGLVSMNGRQRESLLTSLPLAIPAYGLGPLRRRVTSSRLGDFRLATGGCGQLLGSDESGRGVALRIHGVGVRTVHVAGELYLAQQLVFRAVATGARVLVCTDRVHAWRTMVDSVATPDRLRIDGGHHRRGPVPHDASTARGRFDLVVQDYSNPLDAVEPPPTVDGTVLTVVEHPSRAPAQDPDVSVVQPGAVGDRIVVRTPRHRLDLVLVTIAQETAFIGRPRNIGSPGTGTSGSPGDYPG